MSWAHPKYNEYCKCDSCNMVKYCIRRDGWNICYSCDNNNFKGLKGIDNVQRRDSKQG